MSIIKHRNKSSGVVYVYESESYWDKEKKQPRSRRTLLGKLDEETGEIIPTGKSGRKKSTEEKPLSKDATVDVITGHVKIIEEKDIIIKQLKEEIDSLKKEKEEILKQLQALCIRISK